MITNKLFLASSSEFCDERKEFEIFIARKSKELRPRDIVIDVVQKPFTLPEIRERVSSALAA